MAIKKVFAISLVWITAALLFDVGVYVFLGQQKSLEFLTGYLIELSLSIDNLFVFLLIFTTFKVPLSSQSRILSWGVIGAQLMRALMILAGIKLLNQCQWLVYGLGLFLVWTGVKAFAGKGAKDEGEGLILKFKELFPALNQFWMVLIIVEAADLIFALDSIPAVLAITRDPFVVYTSNIFAVLGLRSMYLALSSATAHFKNLHYALGIILIFTGLKMLFDYYLHIPTVFSLGFIIAVLALSFLRK
ncbi:MAG: hypothetical protein KGK03_00010 [Candidatus Omnitrophica bacterium]|nr:hypothetical protein [Candidatus Omnitrophota bacterium]MDE2221438.1 hypothetical protein [Candidatus Omnitrophota bacterium]